MSSYQIEPKNRFFQMVASIIKHEINPKAKINIFSEADLTNVEAIRERAADMGAKKPSYTAFVVKAVALALRDHPYANRRVCRTLWPPFLRPRLQRFEQIDVTVAIERQVPDAEMVAFVDIIRDADQLSITEINDKLRELAESDVETNKQWREYSTLITRFPMWFAALMVRLPLYLPGLWVKYRGGSTMVSSPGKYGVDTISANWWAPVGISFGMVKKRAIVRDDAIVASLTFILTLNFDVRVMAGAQAAQFGKRFIDLLERAGTEMVDYIPEEWQPASDKMNPGTG